MPPVDSTPDIRTGNFELLYSLNAYNKIPVHEYMSKKTGLTVVIAEVDGPVVNGYFCLVTEAFDDDGLPHTLEHLIFLGSEQYPYKGVLDLLANRCLASGTNAWTDTDHTCYTMETAGSEGFLSLMPIFLDHILYPVLSDEGFVTEVHHITGTGEDAGVVYCEMQGRENSAESRLHLRMNREMYPGVCGYKSETGGIMMNLRESTNNVKVRNYHKEFYRPENLKIIITGQVKPSDVFKALAPLEDKIISKGDRGPFTRPWQDPVPPLVDSKHLKINYPSDEENNGLFSVAWRGPSVVNDLYTFSTTSLLLKYLTDFSVSPLQKEFVEVEDPYASKVVYNLTENSESCLYLIFENVPIEKLPLIKPKLDKTLKKIVEEEDIDMERMKNIINRHKLENLSSIENSPHHAVAFMIIGHMLYGNTREDLEQRINPLVDLEKALEEPKIYWVQLLRKYLVENKVISIEAEPSIKEKERMASEEKLRIEMQIKSLGEDGLKVKEKELEEAIDFNERDPPDSMLTSVPIPSIKSINFHNILRHRTDFDDRKLIDLSKTPIFTYFDHIKTEFVYMFALMDTSNVPKELRLYMPLLLEAMFESPIQRGDTLVSFEDVVTELNNDTVSSGGQIGLSPRQKRFAVGLFAQTASIFLQVESAKYEKGITWMKELLYSTVFNVERLKIIATKMVNDVAQAKRRGGGVVAYLMRALTYKADTNHNANGIITQHNFLNTLLEDIEKGNTDDILKNINQLRDIISDPANMALYFAGNLEQLKVTASKVIEDTFEDKKSPVMSNLQVTPDWKLQRPINKDTLTRCAVGMGCLESSFFYQTVPSINSYDHADVPALLLYCQYLVQAEGPMWKQIRGKGLSYGYTMLLKPNEGLLYLVFTKATNVVGAYKEARDIVLKQTEKKEWDLTLLESAKSSLIFEIIEEEKTIGNAVSLSLASYFQGVDYTHNRKLLGLVMDVTVDDLNRVGDTYVAPLFDASKVRTTIVSDPAKLTEIRDGFKRMDHDLHIFQSIDESFLVNDLFGLM